MSRADRLGKKRATVGGSGAAQSSGGVLVICPELFAAVGRKVPKELAQLDGQQVAVRQIKPTRAPRGGPKPAHGTHAARTPVARPREARPSRRRRGAAASRGGDSGDGSRSTGDDADPPPGLAPRGAP